MKRFFTLTLIVFLSGTFAKAQFFTGDIQVVGTTLIFKVKCNGTFTDQFTDMEFYIRWSASEGNGAIFSAAIPNTTDFPGLSISQINDRASDPGYHNQYFYYLSIGTAAHTYVDGTTYELFRTTVSGVVPSSIQLVADNTVGDPYYFAVIGLPADHTAYFPVSAFENETGSDASFYYKDFSIFAILPISLKSFTGNVIDCNAVLDWTTESEMNSNTFEIQHGDNAISFVTVASVPAAGRSSDQKHYSKTLPLTAPVNYYRLKMLTSDDKVKYSNTIILKSGSCYIGSPEVVVYPNPIVDHIIKLTLSGFAKGSATILVEDATGNLIATYTRPVTTGINPLSLSLPISANGFYVLKINSGDSDSIVRKIIVR